LIIEEEGSGSIGDEGCLWRLLWDGKIVREGFWKVWKEKNEEESASFIFDRSKKYNEDEEAVEELLLFVLLAAIWNNNSCWKYTGE
jgi:hypothetical protein